MGGGWSTAVVVGRLESHWPWNNGRHGVFGRSLSDAVDQPAERQQAAVAAQETGAGQKCEPASWSWHAGEER